MKSFIERRLVQLNERVGRPASVPLLLDFDNTPLATRALHGEGIGYYGLGVVTEEPVYKLEAGEARPASAHRRKSGPRPGCKFVLREEKPKKPQKSAYVPIPRELWKPRGRKKKVNVVAAVETPKRKRGRPKKKPTFQPFEIEF